ncbi:MAG: TetR/AcrR family transcriptional regulator [Gammaproteobacteria bacterium]|nr:TetR/AcrR family transcriptional regulator [Gammaproteobacteria bacterium]
MSAEPKTRQVLSRERWMELAMQTLAREGKSKFSLHALLKAMPVSKGSFYWHFQNRADFLFSLVEYWDRHDTETVIQALEAMPAASSPQDKLWELMCVIYEAHHNYYDLVIRALTLEFPELHKAVSAVDRKRFEVVKSLFSEMGFTGDDLEMRTHTFVVTTSLEQQILVKLPKAKYDRLLKLRHQFFIRP